MPNVGRVIKEETRRIARQEVRTVVSTLRKDNIALKRTAADLKRRVAELERANRLLSGIAREQRKEAVKPSDEELSKARVTGKMIAAIRRRLKLTQSDFARLLSVTPVTVWLWENKEGRIKLRTPSKAAILAARKMKSREAKNRLQEIKQAEVARSGKKRSPKKKAKRS